MNQYSLGYGVVEDANSGILGTDDKVNLMQASLTFSALWLSSLEFTQQ